MVAEHTPLPTDAELELLTVLWERGPSTVRQVLEGLDKETTGYTTVLKLLQIMHEKGLVSRDETHRAHVYAPCESEEVMQARLLGDLRERAFSGSTTRLVMRALSPERASKEELKRIRALLDRLEEERS